MVFVQGWRVFDSTIIETKIKPDSLSGLKHYFLLYINS